MMTEGLGEMEMKSIHSTNEDDQTDKEFLPIKEFPAGNKLPCVIHLSAESSKVLSTQLDPYLDCPLLANTVWKDTVTKCRTTMKIKDGPYQDIGATLFIPSMYEGLFEIIPSNGNVNHYVSIAEIAEVMPTKFFNCTPMIGMSIVEMKDRCKSKYIQKGVAAGSTLTVDSIFTAKWKTEAETGLFKKTKINYTLSEQQYIKCIDFQKEVVYLPLSAKGRFYTFHEPGKTGMHVVYRINELTREFDFPLKVRLIYGTSPVSNVKFTDMLTLYKKEEKTEMIIACPIGLDKHHFIDIPIKAGVYFKLQDYENITESNVVSNAVAFSRKFVKPYQRRIRESKECDAADENNSVDSQKQDDVEMPLDLLKDLSIHKQSDREIKLSNFEVEEGTISDV